MCLHSPPKLENNDPKVINIQYYLLRKKIETLEKQRVTLPQQKDKKSLIRRFAEWCGFLQ